MYQQIRRLNPLGLSKVYQAVPRMKDAGSSGTLSESSATIVGLSLERINLTQRTDDEWIPNSKLDNDYAEAHYDMGKLNGSAAHYKIALDVYIYPLKHLRTFRNHLDGKPGEQSSG